MRKKEFRIWLETNGMSSSRKMISDYISRAKRVETELKIDFDSEFELDGGKRLLYGIQRYGKNLLSSDFPKSSLPIGTTSFCMLQQAVKKYFLFKLDEKNGLE